jgi:hypothetical protein
MTAKDVCETWSILRAVLAVPRAYVGQGNERFRTESNADCRSSHEKTAHALAMPLFRSVDGDDINSDRRGIGPCDRSRLGPRCLTPLGRRRRVKRATAYGHRGGGVAPAEERGRSQHRRWELVQLRISRSCPTSGDVQAETSAQSCGPAGRVQVTPGCKQRAVAAASRTATAGR